MTIRFDPFFAASIPDDVMQAATKVRSFLETHNARSQYAMINGLGIIEYCNPSSTFTVFFHRDDETAEIQGIKACCFHHAKAIARTRLTNPDTWTLGKVVS